MTITLKVTTDVRQDEKVLEFEPIFFGSDSTDQILEQARKLMKNTKWHSVEIINNDFKNK